MSATINTFPPFQSMNSPRGWILAVIVLLHLGFFWALSSGMAVRIVDVLLPPSEYIEVKTPVDIDESTPPQQPVEFTGIPLDVPAPTPPDYAYVVEPTPPLPRGPVVIDADPVAPTPKAPVVRTPEIDPRIGLSEPAYPASEIRMEHTGTVLLSVYVLANGRVGDVRVDQSSGWPKLDESALREARRWRFKAGMQDGVPMPMWRQVPITFQLQGRK